MTNSNPYLSETLFVGRQKELEEVSCNLRNGVSVLLIGGRRCGKTSLMRQVGDLGRTIVYLDAGGWCLDSLDAALDSIGKQLDCQCRTLDELKNVLISLRPLAVVIDEADQILHCRWAGSFLRYLRYVDGTVMRTRIAFALVGGPSLSGYRNPDDDGSPVLNISQPVFLQPLDYAARRKLLAELRSPSDERLIFRAAGGHPWLLTRLLRRLWDGLDFHDAYEEFFADALVHFHDWKRQLGDDGVKLLQLIPSRGVKRTAFSTDTSWSRYHAASVLARSLCLVDLDEKGQRVIPGPRVFRDWLAGTVTGSPPGLRQRKSRIPHVRVYVSSPRDVADERQLARRVVERLAKDPAYRDRLKLDPILSDDPEAPAPMLAQVEPQESVNRCLARPSDCEIVVTMLWSRMGTPLEAPLKADGTPYMSGTEWEFEDALKDARTAGRDVLLFRCTREPLVSLNDPEFAEKKRQLDMVEAFFQQLKGTNGGSRCGYASFDTVADFERQLEHSLRTLLTRRSVKEQPGPRDADA